MTGPARTPMPTAQGMAISMLNFTVSRIFFWTAGKSLWVLDATMLGIIEVPREEAMATGTLVRSRYSPP